MIFLDVDTTNAVEIETLSEKKDEDSRYLFYHSTSSGENVTMYHYVSFSIIYLSPFVHLMPERDKRRKKKDESAHASPSTSMNSPG